MRTLDQFSTPFSMLEKKTKPVSHTEVLCDRTELSNLLKIQRCTLNSNKVISEELPDNLELHISPKHDRSVRSVINGAAISAKHCNNKISSNLKSNLKLKVNDNKVYFSAEKKGGESRNDHTEEDGIDETFKNLFQNCQSFQRDQKLLVSKCNNPEIKSGSLVFICNHNDHKPWTNRSLDEAKVGSAHSSRYPVTVKIYNKNFNFYAIVSRSHRHQRSQSFYMRLKQSNAMQSSSDPSVIVVTIDSYEQKYFCFEASSPDSAREWVEAFSTESQTKFKTPSPTNQVSDEECKDINGRPSLFSFSSSFSPKMSPTSLLPVLWESIDEEDLEKRLC